MRQTTIDKLTDYIINNHDTDTIGSIDCAFRLYYDTCVKNKDEDDEINTTFVFYMKKLGLTDANIYKAMAIGLLKVWRNKHDLYYNANEFLRNNKMLLGKHDIGTIKIDVELKDDLPEKVEDYIENDVLTNEMLGIPALQRSSYNKGD